MEAAMSGRELDLGIQSRAVTAIGHESPRGARQGPGVGPANAPAPCQSYGTIVVIGGGCYGSFYLRQLKRAREAHALTWTQVVIVDRDPSCQVARSAGVESGDVRIATADWTTFFHEYLSAACDDPVGTLHDAIVPSPLMPHLMYQWVRARAVEHWPSRPIASRPIETVPGVPWQRAGPDGTYYVSFAEWVCPVNCIEPAICPKTRAARWWTMPDAVQSYVSAERATGRPLADPVIFHCTHRAYGVGMFDTATAVRADAVIREAGRGGPVDVLVGTVSHCHGALSVLTIG
jgi:hypothetical protein